MQLGQGWHLRDKVLARQDRVLHCVVRSPELCVVGACVSNYRVCLCVCVLVYVFVVVRVKWW
jgi:hypothetical protein